MDKPVERPLGQTFVERPQLRGEIEFRNVKFAYPGRSDAVLDGLSFKIAAGERVALIGRVGSGKSTIEREAIRRLLRDSSSSSSSTSPLAASAAVASTRMRTGVRASPNTKTSSGNSVISHWFCGPNTMS